MVSPPSGGREELITNQKGFFLTYNYYNYNILFISLFFLDLRS